MSSTAEPPSPAEVKDKAAASANSVTETGEEVLHELVHEDGQSSLHRVGKGHQKKLTGCSRHDRFKHAIWQVITFSMTLPQARSLLGV